MAGDRDRRTALGTLPLVVELKQIALAYFLVIKQGCYTKLIKRIIQGHLEPHVSFKPRFFHYFITFLFSSIKEGREG